MIVISKISNKKLIKGQRYEVLNLWNTGSNQKWVEAKVQLIGFGRYSVDSFTDTSGNPLPKTNYFSTSIKHVPFIKHEDCKVGEILVCNSDQYKTMAKDSMYKIEKLDTENIITDENTKKTKTDKLDEVEPVKKTNTRKSKTDR